MEQAAKYKQPAIALTDHKNMSGAVQLYKAGQKYGIKVFPGMEGYLTVDSIDDSKEAGKFPRYHIGLIALNLEGYQSLVQLSSLSFTRPRFNRFPRFDLEDLAAFSNPNVAVLTGCYFGLVQQKLVREGYDAAKRIVQMYSRWFPNTFVEIQNHNIDHSEQETGVGEFLSEYLSDDAICEALVSIADDLGLPILATQDSHYLKSTQKVAHDLMKRMVYGGDDGVNEFPGDSFHLASTDWVEEHHDPEHWQKALKGSKKLLKLHDLKIPPLDNYKPDIPTVKKNPQAWLEKKIWKQLDKFEKQGLLVKPKKSYVKQAKHELDTIEFLGQAGYFTIWDQVMKYCRSESICVEARGSANGSLICYLLEITQVDPLQWGLLFERFLSRDRKKPPDIDLDVEDNRRDDIIAFLQSAFGVEQIGTYSVLGAREEDDRGSILVTYNSYLRKKIGNDKFVPLYGGKGLESIEQIKRISTADHKGMRQLSKLNVRKSYGVHPAGMLLNGDHQRISDYVPTMLVASSNTRVSQFTGDDVEELGYLKLDILGQKTLRVMRRCQELIGIDDPTDFRWIPLDDKRTCKYLSKGFTDNGVFQFEGYSMAVGARSLKVRNTNDCILAGALFRPACIDSGITRKYIDRRFDKDKRSNIEYPHEAFEKSLKKTHGLVLYQEQVLEIMRHLGLDYEGINTFFKIVKDSGKGATGRNLERLKEVKKQWADLCEENDIDDPDWAWDYIEGYVSYGFNKAHATGYGVRSYRVAYLKNHYPLEFHAALLETWAGAKKEPIYIRETRSWGIRLLPPDVNYSNALWTIDAKRESAIRKGLASIKGIGLNAGSEIASNRPYKKLDQLLDRNSARAVSGALKYKKEGTWSGILEKLKTSGALVSLGIDRDE